MNNTQNQNPAVLFLIPAALTAGVVFFVGMTFLMQSGEGRVSSEGLEPSNRLLSTLSLIHAAFAVVMIVLSQFIYSNLIAKIQKPDFQGYLRALIIKFALLEGTALFGVIVVFLAGGEALEATPAYYLNYLSSAYMVFEFVRFIPVIRKMQASLV